VAAESGEPGQRLGRAYFPLVGAALGLVAGAAYLLTTSITSPLVAAVVATATLAVLTGGLHLDGLADAADGLLSPGRDGQRLEVMRDPRIGSFGGIALVLVLAGDVGALASMPASRALVALIVAGALSRWAMLGLVAYLPYVREDGLGVAARGPRRALDVAAGTVVVALACLLDWRHALAALLMVGLAATAVAIIARRRIGGATGDVYGAVTELTQLAALLAFAAAA
jgi:adenosylcobinamide-GDP ribazoletransferase